MVSDTNVSTQLELGGSNNQSETGIGIEDQEDSGINSEYLESTQAIVDLFHEENDPDYIYALVSGGGDSTTACVAAQEHGIDLSGIVHVNTGTGIERTRRYVMDQCLEWDLPYHELTSLKNADLKRRTDGISRSERKVEREDGPGYRTKPNPYKGLNSNYYGVRREKDHYEKLVRKMGFPGPSQHWYMYLALKHKPIRNFVEKFHDEDDVVAFVSGVREDESNRRAENMSDDALSTNWGGCTVVSPVAKWTESEVTQYKMDQEIESNPVNDTIGMSGECLCGAYGDREELKQLRRWGYDDAADRLESLEMEIFDTQVSKGYIPEEYALWGHGNNREVDIEVEEEMPQMLLCADCEESCEPAMPGDTEQPASKAEGALDNEAHCAMGRWYYCPDCETIFDDPMEHRKEVHSINVGAPYLNEISWDIREIQFDITADGFNKPLTTDPKLTKTKRQEEPVSQTHGCSLSDCNYCPTDREGVSQCSECGAFKIQPEAAKNMFADSAKGKDVEDLITVEKGVVSTIITEPEIDETKVITNKYELKSVLTAKDIVEILTERLDSVSEYLDRQLPFEKLVHNTGIGVFLDEFDVPVEDVFYRRYYGDIISALEDVAEDEDDDEGTLQAEYDPRQQNVDSFFVTT